MGGRQKDLTPDDLIAFPIPEFVEDCPDAALDDCRFYGMMIGDGHIARDGKAAHITQNRDTDDINFIKQYLYQNGIRWTETAHPEEKKIRFTWSAHLGFNFSRTMLNERGEKRIQPFHAAFAQGKNPSNRKRCIRNGRHQQPGELRNCVGYDFPQCYRIGAVYAHAIWYSCSSVDTSATG